MESLYRVNSDKLSSKIKFDSLSSIYQFITQLRFAWYTTVSLLILFLYSAHLSRPQNKSKKYCSTYDQPFSLNQQINVITNQCHYTQCFYFWDLAGYKNIKSVLSFHAKTILSDLSLSAFSPIFNLIQVPITPKCLFRKFP